MNILGLLGFGKKKRVTDVSILIDKYQKNPLGRENRFHDVKDVKKVQRSVHKEVRLLLTEEREYHSFHPFAFLKQGFSFATTTAVIFMFLILASNFSAYSQVVEFWWDSTTGKTEQLQASLEKITQKDTLVSSTNNLVKKAQKKEVPLPEALAETSGITQEKDSWTALPMASLRNMIPRINIPVLPPDNRIIIPSIGQNIPIMDISPQSLIEENWQGLEKDLQEALRNGVVRYPGTAKPGLEGNVFITGHSSYYLWEPGSYKDVFALLHNVEIGDHITVYYQQQKYTYVVEEKKIVQPDDVDVLRQTDDKRLTLMTCTPIGTALNRLIIVAKQL